MTEIVTNTHELARARQEFLQGFGLDAKRPQAWAQYGYPDDVTFEKLYAAYRRGSSGHGAVHRLLDRCWEKAPRIKTPNSDKETSWEKAVTAALSKILAFKKFKDLDRRNLIGHYAAIIYRVRDGKSPRDPLERGTELVDLVPVFEDQIKVTAWNSDKDSEDYGQPTMFQYRTQHRGGDRQGKPEEWADVHPSRVQILAEGAVGDFFDGVPLLEAGFNKLVDLEKIEGGSAESYLKNSARTIVFKYDAGGTPLAIAGPDGDPATSVKEAHEAQAKALNRNQDASIVMQGGEATTLQTVTSDPKGAWEVAANAFAASVRIPFTILYGQQTGRLASDEDKADFAARCLDRQTNELTPMLEEFVRRMQAAGIFPAGAFEIEWPTLNAPSDEDKFTLLGKATAAAQQAFQAGLTEPLLDANELRKIAGFEPRADDGMPTEGDPARPGAPAGDDADPAAAA